MFEEWVWAAIIIAIPIIVFVTFEILGLIRRRRSEAVARRPKEVRRDSSSTSRRGRAG